MCVSHVCGHAYISEIHKCVAQMLVNDAIRAMTTKQPLWYKSRQPEEQHSGETESGSWESTCEVTHEVTVSAECASDVVVELAIDAEVEGLAGARLAHGEGSTGLEALLSEHRGSETDVGKARDDGGGAVEVRGAGNGGNHGGRDVLKDASIRVSSSVLRHGHQGLCAHLPILLLSLELGNLRDVT
jgi:hypothetical protein